MNIGKIKFFKNKEGYGFIEDPNVDKDVFIHATNIKDYDANRRYKGLVVEYTLDDSDGRYKAKDAIIK